MSDAQQQIVISGVGGQGVLFVTRLLAEAAIARGLSVMTAETHGMAQRGGTVLSHLKVGPWSSPLIRAGQADGLLALKAETASAHSHFLRPSAWSVVNEKEVNRQGTGPRIAVDADAIAERIDDPRAVNLVVLGAALGRLDRASEGAGLFCTMDDICAVIEKRLGTRPGPCQRALAALNAGSDG